MPFAFVNEHFCHFSQTFWFRMRKTWKKQLEDEKKELETRAGHGIGPGPTPLEQSALAICLLGLWAKGFLSATSVQKIAHASMMDGNLHPKVAWLGSLGSFGLHPGNCNRDLMKHYGPLAETLGTASKISVECLQPKEAAIVESEATVMFPHVLFSNMAQEFPEQFKIQWAQIGWKTFGITLQLMTLA